MTLHSAKGLEFDDVFLTGMENGSLPHFSSKDDPEELEEERRLAYVGMTRAKSRLTLSRVLRRMVHGEWKDREPSPFLDSIPPSILHVEELTTRRSGGLFGRGEGADRPERGGAFARGRGSALFPDYENESQEPVFARPAIGRAARPARQPPGARRTSRGRRASARRRGGSGRRGGARRAPRDARARGTRGARARHPSDAGGWAAPRATRGARDGPTA